MAVARSALLSHLLNVFNFDFKSTEPLGQEVVKRSEYREENKTENTGKDWPKKVNNSNNAEIFTAEDDHRNAYESIEEAHQTIESGQYLAGLQYGYADQLFFHSFMVGGW